MPTAKTENSIVQDQIMNRLNQLPLDMQKKVLGFINSLSPKGVNGKELLRFAGIITQEEATELLNIIDKDCGTIDISEW
ncbi:hypothetical protein [Syntrophomonas palmitatica]|uniref:hypothetical protein n=1 Tax=Syntrophomonas palmitatica TaxID=402877 RepID=UPI0006D08878|nr:hypothetical protein [Syntrophomonas palmitatica]